MIYVFVFYLSLIVFRVIFSYARWTFPKVEVSSSVDTYQVGHRVAIVAILLGVGGSIVYDLLKSLIL